MYTLHKELSLPALAGRFGFARICVLRMFNILSALEVSSVLLINILALLQLGPTHLLLLGLLLLLLLLRLEALLCLGGAAGLAASPASVSVSELFLRLGATCK